MQGLILSSFYIGYFISHIPAGILSARFGGKFVLLGGLALDCCFSFAIPTIVDFGGATALIILRIIVGVGEGCLQPACATLMSSWIPLRERSRIGAIIFSGAQVFFCWPNGGFAILNRGSECKCVCSCLRSHSVCHADADNVPMAGNVIRIFVVFFFGIKCLKVRKNTFPLKSGSKLR